MRIACLGNMNNLISPTAQYLAEMGHYVDLFLLHEFEHFRPEADYKNIDEIKFNIKELKMDFGKVMDLPIDLLKKELIGYDFYIGTDYAPAILARINISIDVFAWAGTDLYDWPFYKSKFVIPHIWELESILISRLQKVGIKNAKAIPMSLNNDYIQNVLESISFNGDIINPMPFLHYDIDANYNLNGLNPELIKQINTLRNNSDILFVQQSRQWWYTAPSHVTKGNDVFLNGVSDFKKKNPNVRIGIMLFAYGQDVKKTEELLRELNLSEYCIWIPIVLRKYILAILSVADIGVGIFGKESWYLYCSNAEIMASKIVYMGYRDDEFCKNKNIDLYPMLNANSKEEICDRIQYYHENKLIMKEYIDSSYHWLLNYNLNVFLEKLKNMIANSTNKQLFLGDRIYLFKLKLVLSFYYILNWVILKSKITFLRKSILQWEK